MESRAPLKKDWILTRDAFDALLARLDQDRERAAHQYEHIRRALITFFECRGSASPEDHADATINRVARRLAEGREIHAASPVAYFYGIARNILKESWEASARFPASIEGLPRAAIPSIDPDRLEQQRLDRREQESRLECLQGCLRELTPEARELIGAYYQGETSVKIRNRKLLGERLGIPLSTLRIRALRIREKLEGCVASCVSRL